MAATIYLVSHFHWDREWYRTMQAFRARLVDALDAVLELAEGDADYRFLLDGQTVVLEDYLVVRPQRAEALRRLVGSGQLGIGPWYVQPDSLLPSGESHVRNLQIGRRVGERFGAVSSVAYVPDSFGHPAQFPEIFCGFGLDGFVYWRGNGNEHQRLGARWCWLAPSGASVRALLLSEGYFCAARPGEDAAVAAARLGAVVEKLRGAGERPLLLMNGFDHTGPDVQIAAVAAALGERSGAAVDRALLDDVVAAAPPAADLPVYSGDLIGGRLANLLPGVWSARMPLKIRNRRVETALQSWAEPWAALGAVLGLDDERPSLRQAWRVLLQNQAHDSICGCSIDAVHARMLARYDDAEGLADETTTRLLERLAGRPRDRSVAQSESQRITVFNPSPHRRSDRVRVALDGNPSLTISVGEPQVHPLTMAALGARGYNVDGTAARVIESTDPRRVRWLPDQRAVDVEFVAADVPAFGCRTFALEPTAEVADVVDRGTVIKSDAVSAEMADDGTITAAFAGTRYSGLFAVEDIGDRGDSYDHDPVGEVMTPRLLELDVTRRRHPCGIEILEVRRVVEVPEALAAARDRRSEAPARLDLTTELTVAPGVPRLDARVTLTNRARDHRLRLLFPSGAATMVCSHATTFDTATRSPGPADGAGWLHPAPPTFCHQGWLAANGLCIAAPGLPEAEVAPDGVIALTLVRSVGWLARYDLRTRPVPAGPAMETPGAQVLQQLGTELSLFCRPDAAAALDAVAGLRGVLAGEQPILADQRALLTVESDAVVLSALKPADDGNGMIVRLLNPSEETASAELRFGFPVASVARQRLDETPLAEELSWDGEVLGTEVVAHGLVTIRVLSRAG